MRAINLLTSNNRPRWQITKFNFIILLIAILGFANIFYKMRWTDSGLQSAANLWNPTWLLFGPLIFFAYKVFAKGELRITSIKNYLHLLPTLAFSVFYLVVLLKTDMNDPWNNSLFVYYQNSYFVIIISLLNYAIWVVVKTLRLEKPDGLNGEILLISIGSIFVLTGLVITMIYMAWGIIHVDLGVDYRLFSYALLFFANIVIFWYWIVEQGKAPQSNQIEPVNNSYRNSTLDDETAKVYKAQISGLFETTTIYLEPNLTLDTLAVALDIPKHYLSQLFNVFFKVNFHAFVAEYRIAYAIQLLDKNHNRLTIESLSYSCGFNSRTSFNRYFKDKIGLTPSAYQLQFVCRD